MQSRKSFRKAHREVRHPSALRVINEVLECIPCKERGTYNRQDPTMYESGEVLVAGLLLEYRNCSWGVTLRISSGERRGGGRIQKGFELAEIYLTFGQELDGETGKWKTREYLVPRDNWSGQWYCTLRRMLPMMRRIRGEKQYGEEVVINRDRI